jgi:hypothetical protein
MCLANTEVNYTEREIFGLMMICFLQVQDALGTPIMVHTTPQIGSMRINNVR